MRIDWDGFFVELLLIFISIVFASLLLVFANDSISSSKFMIFILASVCIFLFKKRLSHFLENKNYAELGIIFGFFFWYIIPGFVNILISNESVSSEINLN